MSQAILMNGADRLEVMVVENTPGPWASAAISDDPLAGTDGDDRTFFSGPAPMDGRAGFDTVDFSNRIVFDGEYYGNLTLRPGETPGSVAIWQSNFVRGGSAPDSLVGSFTNFEQILMGYRMSVALHDTTQDWSVTGFDITFAHIATGSGNDTITGSSTDDILNPGTGSNTVHGGRGDDTVTLSVAYADSVVTHSQGILRIQTGAAVNLLTGVEHVVFTDRVLDLSQDGVIAPAMRRVSAREGGTTAFTATAGADIMVGYVSTDIIDGLAGDDWLFGASGVDTLKGGLGNDYIDGGVESRYDIAVDTAVFEGNFADYSFSLSNGIWTVSGAASGTDRVVNIETFRFADRSITVGPNGLIQIGTDGADTLTGTTGPDEISGLGGDDVLDPGSRYVTVTVPVPETFANAGDIVSGGAGNDRITVEGVSNGDVLSGDDGDDAIFVGFSGVVTYSRLTAGSTLYPAYYAVDGAPVTINGGAGADTLTALSHAIIDGGAGDDVITVGHGPIYVPTAPVTRYVVRGDTTVRVTGGAGADTFVISNPVGTALVTDFQVGVDRLDLSLSFTGTNPNQAMTTPLRVLLAQQGADAILVSTLDPELIYARLVNVNASTLGEASFLSNTGGTALFPTPYIDPTRILTYGTANADTLAGLLVYGGGGDDVLTAGAGASTLIGGAGSDLVSGGAGDDSLRGDAGSDVLAGGLGADTLLGGDGNDVLHGGLGADVLDGGVGSDVYRYLSVAESTASAFDTVGANGLIDLTSLATTNLSLLRQEDGSTFVFADTADGALVLRSLARLSAASLAWGGDHGVYLVGSSASETLAGSTRPDSIIGGAGDDTIIGGIGADALAGGAGRDTFVYTSFSDSTAAASDNLYDFETGLDSIDLQALSLTSLTIVWAGGSSFVFAQTASGQLQTAAAGRAVQGSDLLFGVSLQVNGVTMIGSASAEILRGSARDDLILGGGGSDQIAGGLGADVFRYSATSDSVAGAADVLTDFTTNYDSIDLRALNTSSISVIRSGGSSFIYAETPTGGFQLISLHWDVNGNDFTYGGAHGVYLIGSDQADILRGTSLADPIAGGAGNDTITGGGGADALFGNGGADTFVYVAVSDSMLSAADGIFGFVSGQDRIDLTGVRTGASDTFGIAYLGTASFLFVDLGGNGTNDMLIQLADTRLLASDIRWSATAGDLEPIAKDTGADVMPVEPENEAALVGLTGWTARFEMDFNPALTGDPHHAPDWYL